MCERYGESRFAFQDTTLDVRPVLCLASLCSVGHSSNPFFSAASRGIFYGALGARVCKIAIVAARTTGVVLLSMGDVREQLATLLQKEPTDIVNIRKTDETPSRISVIDVISAIIGQTGKNASTYLERLRHIHPEIDSVCDGFTFPGRGQRETQVTGARGIIEIVMVLQGRFAARVRREAASILVRYLAGDLALVEEVCANHCFQEELAAHHPEDPRRVFAEAVETIPEAAGLHPATIAAIAGAVAEPILQLVRCELQKTHPWDFHKYMRHNNPLIDVGVILEGDALAKLDEDEHIVRITDYLKDKVAPESWRRYGNKFKNIFAIELKKQKVEMNEDLEQPLYIARVQGEYRIIYTDADDELMANVFGKCKRRFNGIATRDDALLKIRRKQRRIEDYFAAADVGADKQIESEGGSVASEAPSTRKSAASSSSTRMSPSSSEGIALHHEAVAEAPAALRLRAKRGDANIHITGSHDGT